MSLKRGDIYFAELNPVQGSEQGGMRPVLQKPKLPTHVALSRQESGLTRDSVVLAEQIRTIDKVRLQQKVACLDAITMNRINQAMEISMGIAPERFLN